MVFAFEVLCDFAAQETARYRVLAIAPEFGRTTRRIHMQFECAGVRAIQCADGLFNHL